MKTAEEHRMEMMQEMFQPRQRQGATVTCDFATTEDKARFTALVQQAMEEARAEGFKAGQEAMRERATDVASSFSKGLTVVDERVAVSMVTEKLAALSIEEPSAS